MPLGTDAFVSPSVTYGPYRPSSTCSARRRRDVDLRDDPLRRLARRERFGAANSCERAFEIDREQIVFALERTIVVAVLDIRTEPSEARDDQLRPTPGGRRARAEAAAA